LSEGKQSSQERPLYSIFTAVPPYYDLINHIFTWGLDRKWRQKAARTCLSSQPGRVMDLCCGTGDLTVWLARLAPVTTEVTGLDYSPPMLVRAQKKAKRFPLKISPNFVCGDVGDLPLANGYFDCIGISFAFRNLTYRNPNTQRYLAEIIGVLKPGGKFVIVESSQPSNSLIRKMAHLYLSLFVYRIGLWISRNRAAYKYLSESARNFYTAEELSNLLVNAGFRKVTFKRLLFGATAIHIAVK
jgi:demethylmenaquinone methyltransferase / 2-methoxy-6-polyprenyl-1,4-benzoquinol methylase